MTEGVLARRLLTDPTLAGVGAVVLDEFHERHLYGGHHAGPGAPVAGDGAARPADRRHVGHPRRRARRAPTSTPRARVRGGPRVPRGDRTPRPPRRPARSRRRWPPRSAGCATAGSRATCSSSCPAPPRSGAARTRCAGSPARTSLLVLPLHGDLPPDEQDRAVRRADRRKVVLSTNVAETSVTIDGVVAVIDAGLARIASFAPWSGLPTLRDRARGARGAGPARRARRPHAPGPLPPPPHARRPRRAARVRAPRGRAARPRRDRARAARRGRDRPGRLPLVRARRRPPRSRPPTRSSRGSARPRRTAR